MTLVRGSDGSDGSDMVRPRTLEIARPPGDPDGRPVSANVTGRAGPLDTNQGAVRVVSCVVGFVPLAVVFLFSSHDTDAQNTA